jgi:RNA polymerase sigma-70 factor (ECF subfamily)
METPADEVAARLYEAHRFAVMGTCLSLLGSPEEAADATQEVFAKALPVLGDVRHPRAWLQTAARHHCTDLLRRRRLAERVPTPEWGVEREQVDPADVVEHRQIVATTMHALPDRERRVLAHAFLEDAPIGKVAACMGLSYAATLQLLSRARRRAASLAQLPSALVTPKLAHLARLLPRVPAAQTLGSVPRGSAAGGALVICVTLLCGAAGSGPAAPTQGVAVAPSRAAQSSGSTAAPGTPGPFLHVAAPLAIPHTKRVGAVVAGATALRPSPAPCTPVGHTPSTVLWTHSASGPTAGVSPPQLELTSETMQLDGPTLMVRLHVVDMEKAVPPGYSGILWATEWTIAGQTFVASVDFSPQWGANFRAGLAGQTATPVPGLLVTGAGGYVELDIPLAVAGNPATGGVLSHATAWTYELGAYGSNGWYVGAPTTDSAGPGQDFTVGQRCA